MLSTAGAGPDAHAGPLVWGLYPALPFFEDVVWSGVGVVSLNQGEDTYYLKVL